MKKLLSVYGACDIGCVKPNNEDMILLGDEIFRDSSRRFIFDSDKRLVVAVADGVGGLDKGEVASEIALTRLRELVNGLPAGMGNNEIEEAFNVYTRKTHSEIGEKGGSTLAGLLLYEGKMFRFHAGDSRIYLLRDGGLRRLTIDHSLCESGGDPSAPSNIITNSLGGGSSAFIEFAEIENPLEHKDIYLLTSDGLHDLVPPDVIGDTLKLPEAELDEALPEILLRLAKEAGGKDNISVITVKVANAA